MSKRRGKQTVIFEKPPIIIASAAIAGEKEAEGPLKDSFDCRLSDDSCGEPSWERSEAAIFHHSVMYALKKAGLAPEDIDYIFGGDLINQCVSTHYALRNIEIPFLGLYGACSTMIEGMSLAAMLIDGGALRAFLQSTREMIDGQQNSLCGLKSFLQLGKAIQKSFGIRRTAYTLRSVDGYRVWLLYFIR